MKDKILENLKSLNSKTDSQWTQDGLVNLNAFKFAMGGEAVTREQLEEAAPGFNRENSADYFTKDQSQGNGTGLSTDGNEGIVDNAGKLIDTDPDNPRYEIGNLKASEAPGSEKLTEQALTDPALHQETLAQTGNVASQVSDIDTSADGQIKKLLGSGRVLDLDSMSEEDILKLRDLIPERRNQLIEIKELFGKALENEFYVLTRIEEAAQKAEPVEHLADMVKRIHDANVNGGQVYDIDKGRQRVAQPIPPLKK